MLGPFKLTCYSSQCNLSATLICKCTTAHTPMCSNHVEEHVKLRKADHQISLPKVTTLQGKIKNESLLKLDELLMDLKYLAENTLITCNKIINLLHESSNKLLHQIKVIENHIIQAKEAISENEPIADSFLTSLSSFPGYNFEVKTRSIDEVISKIFSIDLYPPQEDYIFYTKESDTNLYKINLNNFKYSVFNNFSKCWHNCSLCKINKNEYIIIGGFQASAAKEYHGLTSIINIKYNTEIELSPKFASIDHGCVLKNNQIFVFGGKNFLGGINSAKKFDLGTRKWSSVPKLPAKSTTSATIIEDTIVVVGFSFDCAYFFDEMTYSAGFDLESNINFYACENFIFGCDCLYEYKENTEKFFMYKISFPNSNYVPCINTTYRKDDFIYFFLTLEGEDELWRIDIQKKKALKMKFLRLNS